MRKTPISGNKNVQNCLNFWGWRWFQIPDRSRSVFPARGEMADTTDLKSAGRNTARVRVPRSRYFRARRRGPPRHGTAGKKPPQRNRLMWEPPSGKEHRRQDEPGIETTPRCCARLRLEPKSWNQGRSTILKSSK